MIHDEVEQLHPPSMGERIEVFRPSGRNVVAGFMLSGLAMGGSGWLLVYSIRTAVSAGWDFPLFAEKGLCWAALGGGWFCVLLGLGIALFLAGFARELASRRVNLYEDGFRDHSRRSFDDVAWGQVERIRETIPTELSPILHFPANLLLPRIVSKSYRVFTRDGREHSFDGNSIKAISRFGSQLRSEADRLTLTWETVEEHH